MKTDKEKIILETTQNKLWAEIKKDIECLYDMLDNENPLDIISSDDFQRRGYFVYLCVSFVFTKLTLFYKDYKNINKKIKDEKIDYEAIIQKISSLTDNSFMENKEIDTDKIKIKSWDEAFINLEGINNLFENFTSENILEDFRKNMEVISICINLVLLELHLEKIEIEKLEKQWK